MTDNNELKYEIVSKTVSPDPELGKVILLVHFTNTHNGVDRVVIGIGDTEDDALHAAIEQYKNS